MFKVSRATQAPSSEDNVPQAQKQPCRAVIHTHLQPGLFNDS